MYTTVQWGSPRKSMLCRWYISRMGCWQEVAEATKRSSRWQKRTSSVNKRWQRWKRRLLSSVRGRASEWGPETIQSVATQCITRCTPGCIAHYLARALNSPYIPLSPWPWPWVVMWTRLKPNSDHILHINNPDPKAKMWGPGVPKIKSCLRISRTSLKSRNVCVFLWVP